MTATAEHFLKGPTNISRTSNCNKLLSTYLFCICGLFFFYLWLLIHNNKLEHREANNKINLNHRTRANRKCWTWRIRFAAVFEGVEPGAGQHRGKTHCAWVQIWASGKLRISGYVLKSNVNKIKSRTAKFENKK